MVSGQTVSLGIAGCLQYYKVNDLQLFPFIWLAVAAGLLLLLLVVVIIGVLLYKVIRRRRRNRCTDRRPNSAQQSAVHSRFTKPNINENSLQDMTSVDASEGGYSKRMSIASDDDYDYLTPSPTLDFL